MKNIMSLVLNYNDYETTKDFINRVQKFDNIEKIIVVDNHSSDNSYNLLRELANNKIDVIQTPKNGGYGYGNNYGIKYINSNYNDTCKYVLISNPDTIFSSEVVNNLLNGFDNEDIAICAPLTLNTKKEKQLPIAWKVPRVKDYFTFSSYVLNRLCKPMLYPLDYFDNKDECYVECVQGSLFMVDLDKFVSKAMYDEDMFLFFEESTIGYRLKKAGYKTRLLLNTSYIHMHSVSINKEFASEYKKRKIMLESMLILMKHENKIGIIKNGFMKVWNRLCLIENYLLLKFFSRFIR